VSEYTATISWSRGGDAFLDNRYSRAHAWSFDGGMTVAASASPHIVPLPLSVAANVDPEEAFVASLSSCHMLFFLSIAAQNGIVVDSYRDSAVGFLERDAKGKPAMTRVILRPEARYSGSTLPVAGQIETIHHEAHGLCFLANSVRTEVTTEIIS
jgi:organic hydroperoxide reductase OsmC/OhrA